MKAPAFISLVVLLAGCTTPPQSAASAEESRALQVARQAVTERDGRSWARDAEYRVCQHGDGWTVLAIRPIRHLFGPPTYRIGDDRMISIDEHGTVTSYVHGY
jgi:hypothetical protein